MEALIRLMISLGLALKRPPHIWEDFVSDISDQSKPAGGDRPRSWALNVAVGAALVGAAVFLYAVFAAGGKVDDRPYFARFAEASLHRWTVSDKPHKQLSQPLTNAAGDTFTLEKFRGQVVFVNLWATWCTPCVKEMPTIAAMARDYAPKGVAVVAISLDRVEDRDVAQRTLHKLSDGALTFYAGDTFEITGELGFEGLPATVIYDRQGREIGRVLREVDWASPEARRLLDAALAE
jgi:thiol-disulfide isomerase/thioredoxin